MRNLKTIFIEGVKAELNDYANIMDIILENTTDDMLIEAYMSDMLVETCVYQIEDNFGACFLDKAEIILTEVVTEYVENNISVVTEYVESKLEK